LPFLELTFGPSVFIVLAAMKVILAGYNLDSEVIEALKRNSPGRDDVSPETLSASYARISRDPRPVDELRRAAREEVERARRSNRTIIFKMGHHSVAEHAVFNFDLIGLSRLAIEELEHFRLCSFTEKSQRYITLKDDFVLPGEVRRARLEKVFVETVKAQNRLYRSLLSRLRPYFFEKYKARASNPKNHPILEGWAKEDARYIVSLATEGQLGLTINARNLELLVRRFAANDLAEIKDLGGQLYALAKDVAPSIILFTEPSDFDAKTYSELADEASALVPKRALRPGGKDVLLVDRTADGDGKVLAGLLHTVSGASLKECRVAVARLSAGKKRELVKTALGRMEFYDSPQREFEFAGLTFELVVSSSCFAQLKRHRLATLTCQPYDPGLGVTVPPSIRETGVEGEFLDMIRRTDEAHARLKKRVGRAADYVLTNAHRRRVLLAVNLRELYHISRLREDLTAQWDIRKLVADMSRLAKKEFPVTTILLGAKDAYPALYQKVFGRKPKLLPPKFWS
jgi:flavin-dependent thymidylate synthase